MRSIGRSATAKSWSKQIVPDCRTAAFASLRAETGRSGLCPREYIAVTCPSTDGAKSERQLAAAFDRRGLPDQRSACTAHGRPQPGEPTQHQGYSKRKPLSLARFRPELAKHKLVPG